VGVVGLEAKFHTMLNSTVDTMSGLLHTLVPIAPVDVPCIYVAEIWVVSRGDVALRNALAKTLASLGSVK
jgi:hypothetical protein